MRELRGRNEAGEAGREAASSDARALREANRTLEARAFEAEREAERLRMQSDALTQQVTYAQDFLNGLYTRAYCRDHDVLVLLHEAWRTRHKLFVSLAHTLASLRHNWPTLLHKLL